MQLTVALGELEKIHKPLLEITYVEKQATFIEPSSTIKATYFMDYYQGVPLFEKRVRWGLGCAIFLVAVVVLWRSITFRGRNPAGKVGRGGRDLWCKLFTLKFIYEVANASSVIMIYALFFVSAWWFTFYKMAARVHILLPSTQPGRDSMYTAFTWIFIWTLVAKTVAVLLKILEQSEADVFIMDWENEAGGGAADREAEKAKKEEADEANAYGED